MALLAEGCSPETGQKECLPGLQVSTNGRQLENIHGNSFFWLGDTGWLLLKKLDRQETEYYLDNRTQKGINVIQLMVIHDLNNCTNFEGDSAFIGMDITRPLVTPGKNPDNREAYDFWDHLDYVIELAARKGIYVALVPIWGSNVKKFKHAAFQAESYGSWLAERYRNRSNVIWLNGGDIRGSDSNAFWQALGLSLKTGSPDQLLTFHPFGRTQSSTWFHQTSWLDFNMIQSGHRRYDQDDTELAYGEDNWRYIKMDYGLTPTKPTLDGEPSYEGIPQGLHDTTQPLWTGSDVRRYAYWSVFAGACGFTYGQNEVMQFHRPGLDQPDYGATLHWKKALDAPGAGQLIHLKKLLASRPFKDLLPDPSLVEESQGERYNYLAACRGKDYAFLYTYTGRTMKVTLGKIKGTEVKVSWYDPRTGAFQIQGEYKNTGIASFNPPGEEGAGKDWVLVLDSKK